MSKTNLLIYEAAVNFSESLVLGFGKVEVSVKSSRYIIATQKKKSKRIKNFTNIFLVAIGKSRIRRELFLRTTNIKKMDCVPTIKICHNDKKLIIY